jgi:CheY-like chemotaxis protein
VELGAAAAATGGEAVRTARARIPGESTAALDSFAHPADLVLIEVILPKMDVPEVLSVLARVSRWPAATAFSSARR